MYACQCGGIGSGAVGARTPQAEISSWSQCATSGAKRQASHHIHPYIPSHRIAPWRLDCGELRGSDSGILVCLPRPKRIQLTMAPMGTVRRSTHFSTYPPYRLSCELQLSICSDPLFLSSNRVLRCVLSEDTTGSSESLTIDMLSDALWDRSPDPGYSLRGNFGRPINKTTQAEGECVV